MDISALLEKIIVIFFAVGCGFFAGKKDLIDDGMARKLSRMVIYITTPMLAVDSVLSGGRMLSNGEVYMLTGIALASYAFLILAAKAVPRLLRIGRDEDKKAGMYEFMFIFSNIGYMGYPVLEALFGKESIFFATIFIIPFNILCFTYGIYLMSGKERSSRFGLHSLLQPVIIAALLSYMFYICDVQVPAIVTDCIGYVGDLTTPLALLVLGSVLSRIPLGSVFGDVRLYILSFVKLVALPVAVYYAVRPFVGNELLLGIIVVMMGMPVAINAAMVALEYDGDQKTASAGVFLSTVLSLVTMPLVMWFLFVR